MRIRQISTKVSPILDVLTNRFFRRLWIGQIASQLASNMLIFFLAILLYRQTGSNASVSGLFLSYGLPALMFGAVAGVIVDRLDRRAVLLLAHATRALLVLPVFLFSGHLGAVYLLVFLYAIIMQLAIPSEVPLILQFVPKTHLISANSLFSFTFYSSMAMGFICAGPALRLFGGDGMYLLLFSLFSIAAVSVFGLSPQGAGFQSFSRVFQYDFLYIMKRLFHDLDEGIRYVASSHALRDAVVLLTGTQITLVLLGTLGPGFADTVLHIDVRDASLVIVGPAILGILAGAMWIGNKGYRFSQKKLINVGVISAGGILMVVSAIFSLPDAFLIEMVPHKLVLAVALLLFFLLGVANSFLDVPSNSILQKEARGEVRGRVYGILSASIGGAGILPVVTSGVLADFIGVGSVIFLLGVTIFVFGIFRLRYRKTV